MQVTKQCLVVVRSLLSDEGWPLLKKGPILQRETGLKSGTLYPLLNRMAAAGLVTWVRSRDKEWQGECAKAWGLTEKGLETAVSEARMWQEFTTKFLAVAEREGENVQE